VLESSTVGFAVEVDFPAGVQRVFGHDDGALVGDKPELRLSDNGSVGLDPLSSETSSGRVVEPDSGLRVRGSWSETVSYSLGIRARVRMRGVRCIEDVAGAQSLASKAELGKSIPTGSDIEVKGAGRRRVKANGHTLPRRLVHAIIMLVIDVILGNVLVPVTGSLPNDLDITFLFGSTGRLGVVVASQDARWAVENLGSPGLETGGEEVTVAPVLVFRGGFSGARFPLGEQASTKIGAGGYREDSREE